MDLQQLRRDTAADHDAVESAVPLMTADLTLDQYISVLRRFHNVVCAWDNWAARHAPTDLQESVAARRRCTLLSRDLEHLQTGPIRTTDASVLIEQFQKISQQHSPARAAFLGMMYVIEGSTLGGQYIAKHVEQHFGFRRGEGDAYFRGYGDQTMPMWRQFQAILRDVPEEDTPALVAAAKDTFQIFGEWMRRDAHATLLSSL